MTTMPEQPRIELAQDIPLKNRREFIGANGRDILNFGRATFYIVDGFGNRRRFKGTPSVHGYQEISSLCRKGNCTNHCLQRQRDVTMAPFEPDTVKGSGIGDGPPSSLKCWQALQV